ncbi:MAG: hypothetical protein V1734_07240, partial [Nanoarchaeota archaeon]
MKKTTFSQTNSAFRRHWWKFIILDILFLATAFLFFIYARIRIKDYFAIISTYTAQISAVEQLIVQNSASSMGQVQELLEILGPLASQVKFFTFFIVPLVIFALWCLFQAPHYSLVIRNKLLSATDYIRFIVFAAPFYVAGLFVLKIISNMFDITDGSYSTFYSTVSSWQFWLLTLLLIVLLYLNQIFYAFTFKQRYREMANGFFCVMKRSYILFPCYLLYAFAWLLVLTGMVNMFLKWSASNVNGMLIGALPIMAALLLVSWARAFFTVKAGKCA